MKKVIDIDNIMKSTDKDASTMIIKKDTCYEIKMIPDPDNDDDKKWFLPPKMTEDIYREVIKDSSVYNSNFIIKNVKINKSDSSINVCYVDSMLIKPDNTYKNWKGSDSLEYPNDFKYMYLKKNDTSKEYSGWIITEYNTNLTGKFQLVTTTVSCNVDNNSNIGIIDELKFDSLLYGINDDPSTYYEFYFDGSEKIEGKTKLYLRTFNDLESDISKLKSLYFVKSPEDSSLNSIKFDQSGELKYAKEGTSNLIYFNISKIEVSQQCTDASILLYSDDIDSTLHNTSGTLKNITMEYDFHTHINFTGAIDISEKKSIKIPNQSNSVTLLRNHDPLIGYWYTDICRLFSKYDTYVSYYGAFSGFEKNTYIASRGINLKTKDQNGNIIHGIDLTTWVDTIKSSDNKKIVLNITASIINFIDSNSISGYSESWSKNQDYIDSDDISYSNYKSKYIENTILNLIDINNNTKFTLYVDKSSDSFEFISEKPSDVSAYKEMNNVENTIIFSKNRYYMNIENLEPHKYYAEMIIMF